MCRAQRTLRSHGCLVRRARPVASTAYDLSRGHGKLRGNSRPREALRGLSRRSRGRASPTSVERHPQLSLFLVGHSMGGLDRGRLRPGAPTRSSAGVVTSGAARRVSSATRSRAPALTAARILLEGPAAAPAPEPRELDPAGHERATRRWSGPTSHDPLIFRRVITVLVRKPSCSPRSAAPARWRRGRAAADADAPRRGRPDLPRPGAVGTSSRSCGAGGQVAADVSRSAARDLQRAGARAASTGTCWRGCAVARGTFLNEPG